MFMPPKYRGCQQSSLHRITSLGSPIQLWIWEGTYERYHKNPDSISNLTKLGYEHSPTAEGKLQFPCYLSQACDMCFLVDTPRNDGAEVWLRPEDVAHVNKCPVILTFTIAIPEMRNIQDSLELSGDIRDIPMLPFLPPPRMGDYGVIVEGGVEYIYPISLLPYEAHTLRTKLSDALQTLAAPGTWTTFRSPGMQLAAYPNIYNQTLTDIRSKMRRLEGTAKEYAKHLIAKLEECYELVQHVRTAEQKPDWLSQWREIQRLVKDLAAAYYAYHETIMALPPGEALPDLIEQPAILSSKYGFLLLHEVTRSLLNPQEYMQYPDQLIAEHRRTFAKGKGQIIITLSPNDDEVWDDILKSLNVLGDEVVDTYVALIAISIDLHGVQHITTPFYISPDDILETCGKKKSHGSFTPVQRSKLIQYLRVLSRETVQLEVAVPRRGRGKPTKYQAESAMVDILSGKIGEYETITGEKVWEKIQIKIGDWTSMAPGLNQRMVTKLKEILKYHSKSERYEKRLGIYLTLMFAANANRGNGRLQCSMQTLLEQSGITPDLNHPGETQAMIEDALKKLHEGKVDKDKKVIVGPVIGKYGRVVDSTSERQAVQERIDQRAHHWWNDYVRQEWYFYPPDVFQENSRALLKGG